MGSASNIHDKFQMVHQNRPKTREVSYQKNKLHQDMALVAQTSQKQLQNEAKMRKTVKNMSFSGAKDPQIKMKPNRGDLTNFM